MGRAEWAVAIPAYIMAVSLAGLLIPMLMMGIEFLVLAWGTSLLADLAFVVGTVLVGYGVLKMAQTTPLPVAIIVGFFFEFLVFLSAIWLAPAMGTRGFGGSVDLPIALFWIAFSGSPGLLVAAFAPVILERLRTRPQVGRVPRTERSA